MAALVTLRNTVTGLNERLTNSKTETKEQFAAVQSELKKMGEILIGMALRSLGGLAANLTLQVWQRASDLHVAAQSRNNDGPLRFLEPAFANTRRDVQVASAAGCALVALALLLGWGLE